MNAAQLDNVLARKLSAYLPLSIEDAGRLGELLSPPSIVKRGKQLIQEGDAVHAIFVLLSGWTCSYKNLVNGGRQIISFPIAGDCVSVRSVLLRTADHSFEALTDAVVSTVDCNSLLRAFNECPRLGASILWAASRDEAMVVEHLASVGRRSAIERTAHFYLELAERLNLVGLAPQRRQFKCPLNQYALADALGLSAVHVNRVLRELRQMGLLTVHRSNVTIHNLVGLKELSGYRDSDICSR
jgi:CRP-like cAMP-binding protein